MAKKKWSALKGADGKYICAGFIDIVPETGQILEEHDGPVKAICEEIRDNNKNPKEKDLLEIDTSTLTGELKIVVEYLKGEING